MGQLMLKDASEFGGHRREAFYRYSQPAVVNRTGPGRGLGDVEKGLAGIEHDWNAVSGGDSELADQVLVG